MKLLTILALLVVSGTAAPRSRRIKSLVPTGFIRRGYVPLGYLQRNLLQRGLIRQANREHSSEEKKYRAFRAPNPGSSKCGSDEILNDFGSCENAHVTRNVYAFTAPKSKYPVIIPADVPNPELDLNIVFVKAPHLPDIPRPFVLPPPQQKTVVYVLSENQNLEPEVIEVPSPNTEDPEVYFVNYESGENPELPGGIDLHTALSRMPNISPSPDSDEGSLYGSDSFENVGQLSNYARGVQQLQYDESTSFITKILPERVTKLDSTEKY